MLIPGWFKFSPRTWLLMLTMRNEDVCPLFEVAASIMTLWPDRFSSSMGMGLQVEFLSHILFDMRNSRTYVFDNVA